MGKKAFKVNVEDTGVDLLKVVGELPRQKAKEIVTEAFSDSSREVKQELAVFMETAQRIAFGAWIGREGDAEDYFSLSQFIGNPEVRKHACGCPMAAISDWFPNEDEFDADGRPVVLDIGIDNYDQTMKSIFTDHDGGIVKITDEVAA